VRQKSLAEFRPDSERPRQGGLPETELGHSQPLPDDRDRLDRGSQLLPDDRYRLNQGSQLLRTTGIG
jgi:hypothetical protein